MTFEELIQALQHERLIFVMGHNDTGKSTLIRTLANAFFRQRQTIGILDADIGQSDIGPPTTIGFGIVEQVLQNLSEVDQQRFYFVGATSPKGHLAPILIGVQKMLTHALATGTQKILIDTTGLVGGHLGRMLKTDKIDLVAPDVIVCIQHHDECEPILRRYACFERPHIIRISPSANCQKKTPEQRRSFRNTAFQQHFQQAALLRCSLVQLCFRNTTLFSGERLSSANIQLLNRQLEEADALATRPPANPKACPRRSQILRGERIARELHLITDRPLRHHHLTYLKREHRAIQYIQVYTLDELHNRLLGLFDASGVYRGLGILRRIDFQTDEAVIGTAVPQQEIAGLHFSQYQFPDNHPLFSNVL